MKKYYIKKPTVIEAIQMTEKKIKEAYEFIYGQNSVKLDSKIAEEKWDEYENMVIKDGLKLKNAGNGENVKIALVNDFITKDSQGEFYICKPDIFEKAHEEILK